MTTNNTHDELTSDTLVKIQGMIEAAMQAVTAEMVDNIVVKVVSALELVDDVAQPETIELIRKLPEVSQSLEHTLDKIKILEENQTLDTLVQLADLIGAMKGAMTGPMISDIVEKGIQGVEWADDLMQKDMLELVNTLARSYDKTNKERKDQEAQTLFQMLRSLSDKETRQGLTFLLSFLKNFGRELNQN